MKHTFVFLIFAGLFFAACNTPAEQPAAPDQTEQAQPEAVSESGQPLGAAPAAGVNTYCSYHLVRGAGAITTTGATWVSSTAWYAIPTGQTEDRAKFITDLITTLDRAGILAGVDLSKQKANWLIILNAGAGPNYSRNWILDSRDIPQTPK